jgi:hypothetical protein
MSVFDPSALIEQRVREELAPLQQQLDAMTDRRQRRKLKREMRRRERDIRKALSGPGVWW